ncbi:30289_t:CDS:1, partial [Racocetra persica]
SRKEINILLLGETGVGKSTFINAFANYLKFNSLEDAISDEID